MAKNIVICCDGTGNEIGEENSNVVKLYQVLEKNKTQKVFYDPGVGTLESIGAWGKTRKEIKRIGGLAFGVGLEKNVLQAYEFLASQYEDGDQVFMFGFSRGAYTVRVLAGFIHTVGLLSHEQLHLAQRAFIAYKQISENGSFADVKLYRDILGPKRVPIKFLGVWDTVSSIIVPRKKGLFFTKTKNLAYTQQNPSIEIVRHALAIDERRRMFQPYMWAEGKDYFGGAKSEKLASSVVPQDVKQMWFSGVHADIGGGYPEDESGLSKISLDWIINENMALNTNLKFDAALVDEIVNGKGEYYIAPDHTADAHDELDKTLWKTMEHFRLPQKVDRSTPPDSKQVFGFYLPGSLPRKIKNNALIHPSVARRKADRDDYTPVNLP